MSDKPIPNPLPNLYAQLMPKLREVARAKGYAIGLHGSMLRDLDLIAVPWVEEAASDRELVDAMAAAFDGFVVGATRDKGWSAEVGHPRPHGRRTWNICFGGNPFVDVSVAPRGYAGSNLRLAEVDRDFRIACGVADRLKRMLNDSQARAAAAELKVEKEVQRWQEGILSEVTDQLDRDASLIGEHRRTIDGAGCDSGDPLDVSLAEISLGMASYSDALADARSKLGAMDCGAGLSGCRNVVRECFVCRLARTSRALAEAEARAGKAAVLLDCLGKMTRAAAELRDAVLCAEVDLGEEWVDHGLAENGHELFRVARDAVREAMKDHGGICSLLDERVSKGARFNMGCELPEAPASADVPPGEVKP